jgi:hypothetical protein
MPGQTQARDIAKAGDMAATLVLRQTSKSHVGRPLHRSAQESKAEGHVGEKVIPIQRRCAVLGNRDGVGATVHRRFGSRYRPLAICGLVDRANSPRLRLPPRQLRLDVRDAALCRANRLAERSRSQKSPAMSDMRILFLTGIAALFLATGQRTHAALDVIGSIRDHDPLVCALFGILLGRVLINAQMSGFGGRSGNLALDQSTTGF